MADETIRRKYRDFLKQIIRDPDLRVLDPQLFAAKLQIYGILTLDEVETISRCGSMDNRKLELFEKMLPLKSAHNVLSSLGKMSLENKIDKLEKLIKKEWGDNYLTISDSDAVIPSLGKSEEFKKMIEYVKEMLENDCEIMKQHWSKLIETPEDFEMDEMYIDMEIIREGRSTKDKVTTYKDLFGEKGNRKYKKIILEGDPGMGKTTYVHRLVQNWVRGEGDSGKWLNEEFDLVLLVRLGEISKEDNFMSFLSQKLPQRYGSMIQNFLAEPENHRRILLVLDAFDEMDHNNAGFSRLINQQILDRNPIPTATLLVTTRISHIHLDPVSKRDILLRTFGFHPDVVKRNFSNKIENFEALTETHDQVSLYRNPLFVGMAASIGRIPEELFDLMTDFCLHVLRRHTAVKTSHLFDHSTNEEQLWTDMKRFLGSIAVRQIEVPTFLRRHISSPLPPELPNLEELCCETGFLWPKKQASWKKQQKNAFSFPHKLFAEYFAAAYVADYFTSWNVEFHMISDYSEKTEPFSYFLTAFSAHYKTLLLNGCHVGNAIYCVSVYRLRQVPAVLDKPEILTVSTIYSNGPNSLQFVSSFVSTYGLRMSSNVKFGSLEVNSYFMEFVKECCTQLRSLELNHCVILDSIAADVTEFLVFQQLTELILHQCNLSDSKRFAELLFNKLPKSLITFKAANCKLTPTAICGLIHFLLQTETLTELNLSGNSEIGRSPDFAESLTSSSVRIVDLIYCQLSKEFVDTFLHGIVKNKKQFDKVWIAKQEIKNSDQARLKKYPFIKLR